MQHKRQFNLLKFILIMGLLVLEGPCFAQSNAETNPGSENPTTNPKAIETEKPHEAPEEEHDTQDLEKLLKRSNTDSEKIIEDTTKLHNESGSNEVKESEIAEMPGSQEDEVVPVDVAREHLKSIKVQKKEKVISSELSNSVRLALEPLQKLSEEELLKRLDESTKQSKVRPYMDQFPNITILAVRLIKDKESIPSMVKMVEDKDRLVWFASAMLFTVIFGFILKRLMHREGRSFPKAVLYFFIRLYVMFFIRVGVVYYFFSVELTPAAKVFKTTFMNH